MSPNRKVFDALTLAVQVWVLTGHDICMADARAAMCDLGHDRYEDLTDDDLRAIADYIEHDLVRESDLRDAERDRA